MSNSSSKFKLGSLSEAEGLELINIPITEFAYISDSLPVEESTLKRDYGLIIDPLQVKPQGNNDNGRTTSLVRSQTVEEFIYATHIGVVVVPDCKQFALNGVDTAAPANNVDSPQFDGFVPNAGIQTATGLDATARPAQFVWGHDTLQAAWALLNAYDLRMTIGSKHEVFRELAANVGAAVSGNHRGFGTTKISPVPYIRSQNEQMVARAGVNNPRVFLPPTVTAGGQGPTPGQPPLVDVSYGGTKLQGSFGGWYPLSGLLLAPGMPINVLMERTVGDNGPGSYYQRMIDSLSNTQTNFQSYYSKFNDVVTGGAAGFAGAKVWKGGLFRVGILIRGFSLQPLACYQGYQDMSRYFDAVTKATMYRDSSNIMLEMLKQVLETSGGQARLAGMPLNEYFDKKGGGLGSLKEIDDIDFSGLSLPST